MSRCTFAVIAAIVASTNALPASPREWGQDEPMRKPPSAPSKVPPEPDKPTESPTESRESRLYEILFHEAQAQIRTLQSRVGDLTEQVNDLQSENSELEAEKNSTLEAEVTRLQTQVSELQAQADQVATLQTNVTELTSQIEDQALLYETLHASIPTAPTSTVPWNMVPMQSPNLPAGIYRSFAPPGAEHGIGRCPSGFRMLSESECQNVAAHTPPTSLINEADCAEHCDHDLQPTSTRYLFSDQSADPMGCFFYPPFGFYWRQPPSLTSITAGPTREGRSPICKLVDRCLKYTWDASVYRCVLSSDEVFG